MQPTQLDKVQQVFQDLCFEHKGLRNNLPQWQAWLSQKLKLVKEPEVYDVPRRGVIHEICVCVELIPRMLRCEAAEVFPELQGLHDAKLVTEMWREAEALVRRPHTFADLKQLPELRQIISHTAVDVTKANAGNSRLLAVERMMSEHETGQGRVAQDILKEHLLVAPVLPQLLVPQLRLTLAAEVAAGMLCPGQDPPPDTPEHAAVLQLFVSEAVKHLQSEFGEKWLRSAAHNTAEAVYQLWDAAQDEAVPAPPPGKAGSWALSPHLDLHMQLPPQQLLQLVSEVVEKHVLQQQQQQQEQEEQKQQCSSAAGNAGFTTLSVHQLHWQQQQGLDLLLEQLQRVYAVQEMVEAAKVSSTSCHNSVGSPVVQSNSGDLPPATVTTTPGVAPSSTPAEAVQLVLDMARNVTRSGGHCVQQDDREVMQLAAQMHTLLMSLVLNFVVEQWRHSNHGTAAAWQQGVPIQTLLLLLLAEQSSAAVGSSKRMQVGSDKGVDRNTCTAVESTSCNGRLSVGNSDAVMPPAYSGITLTKVLELLQLLRHFRQWNAELDAAAAAAGAGGGSDRQHLAAGSNNGSTAVALDPSVFFSSSGPLATGLWGFSEPPGFGLWACTLPATAAEAASAVLGLGMKPSSSSSSSRRLVREAGLSRSLQLQQLAWQVVLASSLWGMEVCTADSALVKCLPTEELSAHYAMNILHRAGPHAFSILHAEASRSLAEQLHLTVHQETGIPVTHVDVCLLLAAIKQLMQQVCSMRSELMTKLQDETHHIKWLPAAATVTAGPATAAASSSSSCSSSWCLRKELDHGRHALRRLVGCTSQQLVLLRHWQEQWVQQYRQLQLQAQQNTRRMLTQLQTSTSGDAQRHVPPAVTSAVDQSDSRSSSKDNSSSCRWPSGNHNWHPQCPLCCQEQQQQQQQQQQGQQSSTSARHTSVFSSPAVPWSDPFMWRRLLWQLLGKLSPASQAFYAQYLAMCPHCSEGRIWSLVMESLRRSMWSGPTADLLELQLTTPVGLSHPGLALMRAKQYARARNTSFMESYHPGAAVLAKQVLLSLSPLHHSVLPAPETAGLCPSSFRPAVGKLLQLKLLSRPVLDTFQHSSCRSTSSTDLWWHIGLRRWAALQHIKQQQQQQQVAAVPALTEQQLEELYSNPDARLYAAGFAARQLTGCSSPARDAVLKPQQQQLLKRSFGAVKATVYAVLARSLFDEETLSGISSTGTAGTAGAPPPTQLQQAVQIAFSMTCSEHVGSWEMRCLLQEPPDLLAIHKSNKAQHDAQQDMDELEELSVQMATGTADPVSPTALLSDVQSELVQGAPVLIEILERPEAAWRRMQRLLKLRNCDVCDKPVEKVLYCASCRGAAVYCSTKCAKQDRLHEVFCKKLLVPASKSTHVPGRSLMQQLLAPDPELPLLGLKCGGLDCLPADLLPDNVLLNLQERVRQEQEAHASQRQ